MGTAQQPLADAIAPCMLPSGARAVVAREFPGGSSKQRYQTRSASRCLSGTSTPATPLLHDRRSGHASFAGWSGRSGSSAPRHWSLAVDRRAVARVDDQQHDRGPVGRRMTEQGSRKPDQLLASCRKVQVGRRRRTWRSPSPRTSRSRSTSRPTSSRSRARPQQCPARTVSGLNVTATYRIEQTPDGACGAAGRDGVYAPGFSPDRKAFRAALSPAGGVGRAVDGGGGGDVWIRSLVVPGIPG